MKTILRSMIATGFTAACMGIPSTASATLVIRPVSVTLSGQSEFNGDVDFTIDNSGLTANLNTGDSIPGTYPDHNSNTYATEGFRWLPNPPAATSLTFDLGAVYDVGQVVIWQYHEGVAPYNNTRGVASVTAAFSTDDASYSGAQTWNFAAAAGDDPGPFAPTINDVTSQSARYIKFDDITNHGDGSITGFYEIRFTGVAVPEPSSLALLGAGLAMVLGWRRRQNRM